MEGMRKKDSCASTVFPHGCRLGDFRRQRTQWKSWITPPRHQYLYEPDVEHRDASCRTDLVSRVGWE